MTELADSARSVRLAVGVPDLPGIATEELEDSINVPVGEVTVEPLHASISSMKAAMHLRYGDVDEVLAAIERIDARRTDLVNAEHDHDRARDDTAAARQDLDRQRHALADAVDAWRSDLHDWLDELVVEDSRPSDPGPANGPRVPGSSRSRRPPLDRPSSRLEHQRHELVIPVHWQER